MKIQQYGQAQVTRRVATQPTLRTQQIADTTTPILKGLANIAGAMDLQKRQADDTAAEEALIGFERDQNDLFFNPDSGYYNTQGKTAYEGADVANESLAKLQSNYADGLSSPDARRKFMTASNTHVTRSQANISKHSAQGLNDYETATISARVEQSLESAALHYNDNNSLQLQNAVMRTSVSEQADRLGLDGKAKAEMIQTAESIFVTTTINAALAQNDISRANELMGRFGNRLEGKDAQVVTANLNKANIAVDTNAAATKVVGDGTKSLGAMVDEVNEIDATTPEGAAMKTEVMRLVKNRYALDKTIRQEGERKLYENYGSQIQAGDLRVSNIPGNDWDNMTVAQHSALMKLEKVMAKGDDVVTNDVVLSNLLLLPTAELAKVDPTEYFDRVGGSDRDKLNAAVKAARKPASANDESNSVRARSTSVTATLFQLTGKKSSRYNDTDTEFANAFHRMVNVAVQQEELGLGRKLKPIEFDNLLKATTRTAVMEGRFFGENEYDIDDVPAEYMDEITESLVNRGIPVTGDNITRAYIRADRAGLLD